MPVHLSPKLFDLLIPVSFFCLEKHFNHCHLLVDDFARRLYSIQDLKELFISDQSTRSHRASFFLMVVGILSSICRRNAACLAFFPTPSVVLNSFYR